MIPIELIRAGQMARETQHRGAAGHEAFLNEAIAFRVEELDLANLTQWQQVSAGGHKLIYLRAGSAAGGRLDINLGGEIRSLSPGDWIRGQFRSFDVRANPESATEGTARLLRVVHPDADYSELPGVDDGQLVATAIGPDGAATQTANDASANVPDQASDGVSLVGVSGWRVILSADDTRTLSGAGTLKVWLYSAELGRWVYNPQLDFPVETSGVRDLVFPDQVVTVPGGRLYVEADTVTVSAGALTVTVETWGNT